MSLARNVFTVSSASTASAPRVWRQDLDMPSQQVVAQNTIASEKHRKVLQAYSATCSSRKNHRAFLAALIGEARRFCAQRGAEIPDSIFVAAHTHIQSSMAITDTYPKLIAEISSLRLFHLGSKPKAKKVRTLQLQRL